MPLLGRLMSLLGHLMSLLGLDGDWVFTAAFTLFDLVLLASFRSVLPKTKKQPSSSSNWHFVCSHTIVYVLWSAFKYGRPNDI